MWEKFQIKRRGKDKDDIFWTLGKVHGLEYLAYCTEEEIMETGGDPIRLQKLVNRVMDENRSSENNTGSFDAVLVQLQ
jgi:hypothetical protein